MEMKIVKQDDKKALIEMQGETVAFAHMIKDELWKDSSVKEAAAIREHPYLAESKIFVAVNRGSPKSALEKASESIAKQSKELRDKIKEGSKK
jgi:DNA-directed RNA polymerase subunit L